MALKTESSYIDESIGLKVEGELGDFQIIEEVSDSDDADKTVNESSWAVDTVPSIPSSLVKPSSSPIGNVAVSNSENVVIGNNTYFNGPVIIKQVIQNVPGIDNPSYSKTEDEDDSEGKYHDGSQSNKKQTSIKKFQLRKWHKVTFSALCVLILGGIFAVLSIILSSNSQDDNSSSKLGEKDSSSVSNFTTVVGMLYKNINLIIITVILMPITCLLTFYTLLTLDDCGNNRTEIKQKRRKKVRDYDDIQDYDYSRKPVKKENPLLIAPDHLRIVPRTDWLAQPVEKQLNKIRQPVPWVIISHTATENCSTQSECILRVRLIQMFHIESRNWDDIGYNFLVAGDGSAYYGRGWDYIGSHTLGYNKYSIGISFIGTFNNDPPPKKQLDACIKLLKRGVEIGKLAKDYKLFIHRQLASTLSPGDKLCEIIKEWPHFVKNFTDISELIPNY
ncbi:peptidoglycan-recognition protein LC-like isoform X1 [Trichoplusia ni]|uniref:Peptidoglycan recognition protein n=1 Tax=Trichoplusia ni TaxID=7111 RepID=A0A7E5VRS7_TRINI|nr:peptidoglycan-recognition protein LC-like isoform X1 [Trichoplusia ni]